MGLKLGEKLGEVCKASMFDILDKIIVIKVKVKINVLTPIKTCIYIGSTTNGVIWEVFRSEKLPMFCFLCGIIGHIKYHYRNINNHGLGINEVNPLGPWLIHNKIGKIHYQ